MSERKRGVPPLSEDEMERRPDRNVPYLGDLVAVREDCGSVYVGGGLFGRFKGARRLIGFNSDGSLGFCQQVAPRDYGSRPTDQPIQVETRYLYSVRKRPRALRRDAHQRRVEKAD